MEIDLVHRILVVLIDAVGLFLGFWVFFADKKSRLNQMFLFMMVANSSYTTISYITALVYNSNQPLSLILSRWAYGISVWAIVPSYFVALYLIKEENKYPLLNKLIWIMTLFLSVVATFSPWMVTAVNVTIPGSFPAVLGWFRFVFLGIMLFWFIFILSRLLFGYFRLTSKEEKLRVQYFIIGLVIFLVFNLIFAVILGIFKGQNEYYYAGTYPSLILAIFAAFAIVKQKLFGMKVVLVYLLVGSISILLSVDILVFPNGSFVLALKIFTLFIFLYFGRSLINSVLKETELREQLQDLNEHLQEKVDEQTKEIKRAYEVEKKARIDLENLDKSKTQFILATEHHLRTPLTIVKGYVNAFLEKKGASLDEEGKSFLIKAKDATNRITDLVNELLEVSQMGVGKGILKLELVNIKDLIVNIITGSKQELDAKQIKTVISFPEDIKDNFLSLDKEKIAEAFSNLISNATKYNKIGGEIKITGKVTVDNDNKKFYQVSIEDQGIGIKTEELSKLFEHVFERSEEARKVYATGKGIGLAVVKSVVEAHGGTVRAESEGGGRGSRFVVELPI
jgi:signal transduction histidine kinase